MGREGRWMNPASSVRRNGKTKSLICTHPRTVRDPTRLTSPARPPVACRCRCCTRPSLGHPHCAVLANPPAVHTTTRHHYSAILPVTGYAVGTPGGATGRRRTGDTGDTRYINISRELSNDATSRETQMVGLRSFLYVSPRCVYAGQVCGRLFNLT